jgi:hypothetical protein
VQSLIADRAKHPHLNNFETKNLEGVLDLYCAQLVHEENGGEPKVLSDFARISEIAFRIFQDFVKRQFGHTHIVRKNRHHIALCAGAMIRSGIDPNGVKPYAWERIAEFMWNPRAVAKRHKVSWQENKGKWSGTKSWSTQVAATHKIVPNLC